MEVLLKDPTNPREKQEVTISFFGGLASTVRTYTVQLTSGSVFIVSGPRGAVEIVVDVRSKEMIVQSMLNRLQEVSDWRDREQLKSDVVKFALDNLASSLVHIMKQQQRDTKYEQQRQQRQQRGGADVSHVAASAGSATCSGAGNDVADAVDS